MTPLSHYIDWPNQEMVKNIMDGLGFVYSNLQKFIVFYHQITLRIWQYFEQKY